MADRVKKFFQGKLKDQKFKNAGKGHRLNEPSSSSSSSSATSNIDLPRRQIPNDEARTAGLATLARIEAKKSNTPKLNTSYAAIQARAKKELEQEKLQLQNENNQSENYKLDDVAGSSKEIPEAHLMAVKGVFYQCETISNEVLDKETWFIKIEEFFHTQLSDQDAGLRACLIIHNCNEGKERINYCVETLCKYLDNIQNEPSEQKYWKIRMSNKIFQEKVKPLKGSIELLKAAGFVKETVTNQDQEEDFLVWSPERSDINNLTILIDSLISVEPLELELCRNEQVLLPNQAATRKELPADFYILSASDLKQEQINRTKAIEQNQMLLTQAMREKLMKDNTRRYKFTIIRIRFPDNIILQGTFAVSETFQKVIEFVKEHLSNSEDSFNLITATRENLTETDFDKTLESLNLVPAVMLTFLWDRNSNSEPPLQYLKQETLNLLQEL